MPRFSYEVLFPQDPSSCVVFASPHSGREYRAAFMKQTILDEHAIRTSEDAFVDLLFEGAPEFGAVFLKAMVPRAFVDLNRAENELDAALIEGIAKGKHNPRVAAGLGVIPRVVAAGRSIYHGKISREEAQQRIAHYWHPYHQMLKFILETTHRRHGQAVLLDCHSMPREATKMAASRGMPRPEIVLGDRYGKSASSGIVDHLEAALSAAGFRVARNAPFAGAYIAQAYGAPSKGRHVIQIEIDRSIYMDEKTIRPNGNFHSVQAALRDVIKDVARLGRDKMPLAAE